MPAFVVPIEQAQLAKDYFSGSTPNFSRLVRRFLIFDLFKCAASNKPFKIIGGEFF